MTIRAVLFDLDGTLADTAPDLAAALNQLLAEHGRAAVPLDRARPLTSSGARGMIEAGFGIAPPSPAYEPLKNRFLELYGAALCVHTVLFPGMAALLAHLEAQGMRWGIVTNKAARFTDPLIVALGLAERAACIVSGDTTPHTKPHPAPLLHAADIIRIPAEACVYVGDDLRDIQAARAARMKPVAVRYGYLGHGAPPEEWGADALIDHPIDLIEHLA